MATTTSQKGRAMEDVLSGGQWTPEQAETLRWTHEDYRRDLRTAREDLRQKAQRIKDTMNGVLRYLDGEGCSVNTLGELQGSAASFDIACALYGKKVEDLRQFERLVLRLTGRAEVRS